MAASSFAPYFGQSNSGFKLPVYNGIINGQGFDGTAMQDITMLDQPINTIADFSASTETFAGNMFDNNMMGAQFNLPITFDTFKYNAPIGAIDPMLSMTYGLEIEHSMQNDGPPTLVGNTSELDNTGFSGSMAQAIDLEMAEVQRTQSVSTLRSDFRPQTIDPTLMDLTPSALMLQATRPLAMLVNEASQTPELITSPASTIGGTLQNTEITQPEARRSNLALPAISLPQHTAPSVPLPTSAQRPRPATRRSRAAADPSVPKRPVGRPRLAPEDHAVPYKLWCKFCITQYDAQAYKSGEGLRVHMAREHNLVPPGHEAHKCNRCPRQFGTRSELNRHLRTAAPCTKVDQSYWEAQPVTRQDLADTYALSEHGPMSNALIVGREKIPGRSDPRKRNFAITLDDEAEDIAGAATGHDEAIATAAAAQSGTGASPTPSCETWTDEELTTLLKKALGADA